MLAFRVFLIIIIISVIVGFSLYNSSEKVDVNLVRVEYHNVPLIIVVYWTFLIGMIVTFILGLSYVARVHADMREERRQVQRLTSEITALRNRSFEDLSDV